MFIGITPLKQHINTVIQNEKLQKKKPFQAHLNPRKSILYDRNQERPKTLLYVKTC